MQPETFYLASTEGPREGHPWKCHAIKRIVWVAEHTRDDGMLVSLSPPIPADVYGTPDPVQALVLFSRYHGDSLFPMGPWQLIVNICLLNTNNVQMTGRAEKDDLRFEDIGIIGDWEQVNKQKYGGQSEI